jgi:hypothetical protein
VASVERRIVQSVIVLVDPEKEEITDYYSLAPPEGPTIIVFSDDDKLREVQAAVQAWAAQDGLAAALLELQAESYDDAISSLTLMSPHLSQMRFVQDSDPLVDSLLAHIRR